MFRFFFAQGTLALALVLGRPASSASLRTPPRRLGVARPGLRRTETDEYPEHASEVSFAGGVCPSLPAGRIPVITNPPSQNEGWTLVDFCLEGPTGNNPAHPSHCHYNDDDSSSQHLQFNFSLFGALSSKVFINNNGNLSFGDYFSEFTPFGFPSSNFSMIAPFWGDVDTGDHYWEFLGHVWKKTLSPNVFVVAWDHVGYFHEGENYENTFMVMISDGNDELMGSGNNVCFCYDDMQWTTGDASSGSGGHGGVPATVGVNKGDGEDFWQIGRFNETGAGIRGVDFLDYKSLCFSISDDFDVNQPPLPWGLPENNEINLECGGSIVDKVITFSGPEGGQIVTVDVVTVDVQGGSQDLSVQTVDGTTSTPAVVTINWSPNQDQAAIQKVIINATDNGTPNESTVVTLTLTAPGNCIPTYPPTTYMPTYYPTYSPTEYPTPSPTTELAQALQALKQPSTSLVPSPMLSENPSVSIWPTSQPSNAPSLSSAPSSRPSEAPSMTGWPTSLPSESPSISSAPSGQSSENPSSSHWPTSQPSQSPSISGRPSSMPSKINECAFSHLNDCHEFATCTDIPGGYTCTCHAGFTGNGTNCTNVNECDTGEDNCDENAICSDTEGSWECRCRDGWIGDGLECRSNAPTRSPTNFPSKSPTASPSTLPSQQPSIIEQFVTTRGRIATNVDFCAFSGDKLGAFRTATHDTIKTVTGCAGTAHSCTVDVTKLCNVEQSYSRKLQNSNNLPSQYQLDFAITESFTCEKATCNSARDSATVASMVASIATPVEASLDDTDEFLIILSENLLNSGQFREDIVDCFAVWGVVDPVPELEVTPPLEEELGLFYPDWVSHSGTCLQGEPPRYMELNPEGWLFETLEGCCERYYGGWNFNQCMHIKGSGLWYVSYITGLCERDCEEGAGWACGGLANPHSYDLYRDPRSCCVEDLPWVFVEFCEAESLLSQCYEGTGLYYRGDTAGSKVCVRDCDPDATGDATCGGIVEDAYIRLYDTAEECCSAQYGWMTIELCAARTDHVPLNMFWPDKTNSKCFLDSREPAEELSVSVYNSPAECCKEGIHWLSEGECLAVSGYSDSIVASYMFFVDWAHERCVQDCEGAAPCVGLGQAPANHAEMYGSADECCDRIAWLPRRICISSS